jgi:hypothetical protein
MQEEGLYEKTIAAHTLASGSYTVSLFTGQGKVSERLIVVDGR